MDFDECWSSYDAAVATLERALTHDTAAETRSQLDRRHMIDVGALARKLANAEVYYDGSKREAKRLGLWDVWDDRDARSGFFDQEKSSGYAECAEAKVRAGAPVAAIEAWLGSLGSEDAMAHRQALDKVKPDTERKVYAAAREVDDWSAESLDCGASIGGIHDGPYGKKVDEWPVRCEGYRD